MGNQPDVVWLQFSWPLARTACYEGQLVMRQTYLAIQLKKWKIRSKWPSLILNTGALQHRGRSRQRDVPVGFTDLARYRCCRSPEPVSPRAVVETFWSDILSLRQPSTKAWQGPWLLTPTTRTYCLSVLRECGSSSYWRTISFFPWAEQWEREEFKFTFSRTPLPFNPPLCCSANWETAKALQQPVTLPSCRQSFLSCCEWEDGMSWFRSYPLLAWRLSRLSLGQCGPNKGLHSCPTVTSSCD